MAYGTGSLIGLALGTGVGILTEEEERDVALTAAVGGVGGMVPGAVTSYIGRKAKNFSPDAYKMTPIEAKNLSDRIIAKALEGNAPKRNLVMSFKRNIEDTIKGNLYAKMGKKEGAYLDLQKELDTEFGAGNKDAIEEFKKYNSKHKNSTPEELRLKIRANRSIGGNKIATQKIREIDDSLEALKKNPTSWHDSTRKKALSELTSERRKLEGQLVRAGEHGRKYRHEIVKNELHAGLINNRPFELDRIRMGGYNYIGSYRWKDIGSLVGNDALKDWEADVNKFSNKFFKKNLLHGDKAVPVIVNTNRGDKMQVGSVFRKYNNWALRASRRIADGSIKNQGQLKKWLITEMRNDPRFELNMREIKQQGRTIESVAHDMSRQIKKNGGFKLDRATRLRGHFNLTGMGGLTSSYLEGGVNVNGSYNPYLNKKGVIEIGAVLNKTDLQDIAFSSQLGAQRTMPLVLDRYTYRYTPSGIRYNFTNDYPFMKNEEAFSKLKEKELVRGKVKAKILDKNVGFGEKVAYTAKKVAQNPKKAAIYGAKRLPGVVGKAASVGLLAYSLGAGLMPEGGYSIMADAED